MSAATDESFRAAVAALLLSAELLGKADEVARFVGLPRDRNDALGRRLATRDVHNAERRVLAAARALDRAGRACNLAMLNEQKPPAVLTIVPNDVNADVANDVDGEPGG